MATKSNYGKKVETLDDLQKLARAQKAVICNGKSRAFPPNRHMPAAWVYNLNGAVLHSVFKAGLYTYRKVDKMVTAAESR